ncbi:MAG TPA: 23S rRNA pseudouridine(2604) synthase RluF [Phnomibacter sp.]|nr:23S rRNA pseudouridine(2604) synthase RluF [Phnomibacter sp.]
MDSSISLNKFISDTGYCSRREADQLIESGRVLLNDVVAQLGNRYTEGDSVEVDGSMITAAKKEKLVYLALNKPVGITCTTDISIKGNIISFLNYPKRIFPIGRLDKDSEGLIFLTNDGNIVNKILRAGNSHEKEYTVRVNKPIDSAFVQRMSNGVPILDTQTLPCKLQQTGRQTFKITLTQGLNRQIRRMCEFLGYKVEALQRTRIMNIKLDKLATGKWRYLSDAEMTQLQDSVKHSVGTQKASPMVKPTRNASSIDQHRSKGKGTKDQPKADGKNRFAAGTSQKKANQPSSPATKKSGGKPKPTKGAYKTFKEKGRKR